MSNKKAPQYPSKKQRSDSIENKNILVPKKENKMKHVLVTNGNTSLGDGLWCISKNEEPPKEIKSMNSMTKIDKQTENSMISFLEKQLSELGIELEKEKAKNQNLSIEKIRLINTIEALTKKINDLLADMVNEKNNSKKIEDQLENIKELYNRTTRESAKITNDLYQEQQKYKLLTENLNTSVNKNDQELYNLRNEIKKMRIKIEELEEENEDFRSKLDQKDDIVKKAHDEKNKHINELKMQTVNQNEARLEKLAKAMQENGDLSDKLIESENLRRKFMEKCGYQEKELKKIYEDKRDLENMNMSLKKRINDLTILKSSNNKILEDKIIKLSKNLEITTKENSMLKAKIKDKSLKTNFIEPEEPKETLEEVEAKPYLFGPYERK